MGLFAGGALAVGFGAAPFMVVASAAYAGYLLGVINQNNGLGESAPFFDAFKGATLALLGAGLGAMFQPARENSRGQSQSEEDHVDIWRGVHAAHPDMPNALQGKTVPWGGHSDPELHNDFDVASEFTSWTTVKGMADSRADSMGPGGVVLHDRVPASSLVQSPDRFGEFEVLRRGPTAGASVERR